MILTFSSCVKDLGKKYTRGNLEIYYTEEMEFFVEPLADYFEEHNLIFDHSHSIQLTSTTLEDDQDKSIILKMVASEDKEEIPAKEVKNIELLEEALKSEVFEGANFRIAVCNANFVEFEKE